MARFSGRAPYLRSIPSVSRNFLALSVTFMKKGLLATAAWTRCCTSSSSISIILFSSSLPRALNTTILSRRLRNSGVNFRRAASMPVRDSLAVSVGAQLLSPGVETWKPSFGLTSELISAAPILLVMKINAFEKSTLRLSPKVSVALSRIPRSRFQRASLAFSISSNRTKLSLEERKVHMDIEALSLETSEAVSDGLKSCAYGVEMIEPFLQTKVAQVIGAKLVAE